MASRWFLSTRPRPVVSDAEADPNGDAAQRRAWLRGQEASGRVRRFTGPEFVGEEVLADASVDRQLVRFDLATQTSLVLTPDVGDYAEPRFLPSQEALVCSGRIDPESDPAIRRDRRGRFLDARPGVVVATTRHHFVVASSSGDGNLPSPNWTLPMSPTPQCDWGLWGWAAFKIRRCG